MLKWPKEGEEVKLTLTKEFIIDFVKLLHRPHRWVFPPWFTRKTKVQNTHVTFYMDLGISVA